MNIFGLMVGVLLIFGCHRTECPAYADEYLNWIPYKLGDSAYFTDRVDTIKLCVEEEYKPITHNSWIYEQECRPNIYISLSGDTTSLRIAGLSEYSQGSDKNIYYSFIIEYHGITVFRFQVMNNGPTTFYNYLPAIILPSYYNGFIEYPDVLKLEIDTLTTDDSPIYQIYIAESKGVIEFTERKTHKSWSLIGN